MNFLHLTVWSSRARLTSYVVLLCKKAPSTVCFNLRADIFGSSLLSEKAEAGSSSNLPSAFQKLLVNTGWKYILKRIHVKICHKKCLPSFSQFIKYTHFLAPLFLFPKAPFWSPFHSKSGPHFEQLRSPSHVGAVTLILSVFSYIVFTFLYSYIVVYVHFLPGPMTQGILCQGSLVCRFVKNSCIFSLFPKFLYF